MDSFGHTGFTGTCVWVDPQRDLCAVLLTNSVYFGRNDTRDLRAAFTKPRFVRSNDDYGRGAHERDLARWS